MFRRTQDGKVQLRHDRAVFISDAAVRVVSPTHWWVGSQQLGRGGYDVYQLAAQCSVKGCRPTQKCFDAGCNELCPHLFRCTCPDSDTHALCKHVHKVRMYSLGVRRAGAAQPAAQPRQVGGQAVPAPQAGAGTSSGAAQLGKRAQEDAGSSGSGGAGPSASKQQKTARTEWCADCWAAAQDTCAGGHCLLDWGVAEEHAQASLAAAHREVTRQQARLDALVQARVLRSPVVRVGVPDSEGNEDGWMVDGGTMRIAVAATEALTDEDRAAVCAALDDLDMYYEMDPFASTMAYGDVGGGALDAVSAKLPACVEGQAARRGAVLLRGGSRLEVYFKDMPAKGGPGVKVFGYVAGDGVDCMKALGCDGKNYGWSDFGGRYDGCRSRSVDCYCREGVAGTTTFEEVEFED